MAIDLHAFQLVLLRRRDDAPGYDDEAAEQIQRDHLAFYTAMRQVGHVVTNGPLLDQPDDALRGIAIFATKSVDRARELANADPAVLIVGRQAKADVRPDPPDGVLRPSRPGTRRN